MKVVLGRKIILFGKILTREERKEKEREEVKKGNLCDLRGNGNKECWQCGTFRIGISVFKEN